MAESDAASFEGSESDALSFNSSDYSGDHAESWKTLGADCPQCGKRLPCTKIRFRVRALKKWSIRDHLGCRVCSAIIQAASALYELLDVGQSPLSFIVDPLNSSGIRVVNDEETYAALLKVSAACPDEDLKNSLGVLDRSSRSFAETLETCRRWFNACISNHSDCGPLNDAYAPYRLLDLNRLEISNRVFLVEKKPGHVESAMVKYACLSHCWGASQPVKTTTSNIPSYIQEGLAVQNLPSTFRDAIQVTQHMGIRFLWIDSLCIIQDDRMDWETQAAEMSSIYGSSAFTIAATAASGCGDGFLERIGQESLCATSDYGSDPGQNSIAVACLSHHQWRASSESWYTFRDRLPLQKRAWTLQEHLLSPRTLSFGAEEVVWECRSHMYCECGEIIVDSVAGLHDQAESEGEKVQFWQSISAPEPDVNFTASWSSIVEAYASRALTHQGDRRIALQGIVDVIEQRYGLAHMYGHWEYDLLRTLAWLAPAESCTVPEVWRAPTWSWMSLEYSDSGFNSGGIARDADLGWRCIFIAEYMSMKESHRLNTLGLASWDNCPDGTLWLSTWVCDGFWQPAMVDEPRLLIPGLSGLKIDLDYTIHTESSIDCRIEIRCVILAHVESKVYYLICRPRSLRGPLARIGSGRCMGFRDEHRFQLAEKCVKETVAIW